MNKKPLIITTLVILTGIISGIIIIPMYEDKPIATTYDELGFSTQEHPLEYYASVAYFWHFYDVSNEHLIDFVSLMNMSHFEEGITKEQISNTKETLKNLDDRLRIAIFLNLLYNNENMDRENTMGENILLALVVQSSERIQDFYDAMGKDPDNFKNLDKFEGLI